MHPRDISIDSFDYPLPEERIAKFPLIQRDHSRLLQYRNGSISEHPFTEITELIPSGSLMVFNNTRVIHARLLFNKATGAGIEIFCLEPAASDYAAVFSAHDEVVWKCLVGNAKRWKEEVLEKRLLIGGKEVLLYAEKQPQQDELFLVRFHWSDTEYSFGEILHHAGVLPIPPYLNRDTESGDEQTYQTVYAAHEGSVAAPTAGLHFTEAVFNRLAQHDVSRLFLTLHVGAGTFRPVKSETMGGHVMHSEHLFLSRETIRALHRQLLSGNPLISVGTTTLRTLESLFWFGVKLHRDDAVETMKISQWEPYEHDTDLTASAALEAVIRWMELKGLSELQGDTQVMITPGYRVRMADALVTNFHQPKSTLLLLVAAMAGSEWRQLYDYALAHGFRFLSYGDSSLIWNHAT